MGFFNKLFGKNKTGQNAPQNKENTDNQRNGIAETDGETYIKKDNVGYFKKDSLPEYSYSNLSEEQYKHIHASLSILEKELAPLLQFDLQPVNHPKNLDEYLSLWGNSEFRSFLGVDAEQHAAFLAYNFGQYLVDTYAFEWKTKSDGEGSQIVVLLRNPAEIELYPIDSTLRAIENKKYPIYGEIEEKLKQALNQFQ